MPSSWSKRCLSIYNLENCNLPVRSPSDPYMRLFCLLHCLSIWRKEKWIKHNLDIRRCLFEEAVAGNVSIANQNVAFFFFSPWLAVVTVTWRKSSKRVNHFFCNMFSRWQTEQQRKKRKGVGAVREVKNQDAPLALWFSPSYGILLVRLSYIEGRETNKGESDWRIGVIMLFLHTSGRGGCSSFIHRLCPLGIGHCSLFSGTPGCIRVGHMQQCTTSLSE